MADQTIECIECEVEFVHLEKDQEFFEKMGYDTPKRCRECRIKKKRRVERSLKNRGEDNKD